ncbi:MAG: polyhydroxyalkanoate synthase [Paracoccaceae bacterium]|jgi:polyhydroxyalkanoate synthase
MISTSCATAWPHLKNGWAPWSQNLAAAGSALQRDLENVNPDNFAAALSDELARRHDKFLTGLETYRAHPFHRDLPAPPAVWEAGPTRLLDYGATSPAGEAGRPVLVVPSLVNRSYILDLAKDHSFLRFLSSQGFRPLLIDWGTPGPDELDRSLGDYISGDMAATLDVAVEIAEGAPVPVIGYCMGGTLAAALAALTPDKISALILLAAPWDFHVGTNGAPIAVTAGRAGLEQLISTEGCLSVDALQSMFFSIDPLQGWTKFQAFAEIAAGSPAAESFVALEDWLNDGVPLAADVARECLFGWYGDNSPANGAWEVSGQIIDPATIACPTLGIIPAQDRIVPPASAQALIEKIPNAASLSPQAGHIGMMVGRRAEALLWRPLADWLEAR